MSKSPKILSIETSGKTCGVALSIGSKIIAEYTSFESNEHDRLLAEYIRRILQDFNLKVDDLDAVAVSSGPGSFTGLRIGVAMAKSLCFEDVPKLIGIPTLEAFAYKSAENNEEQKSIVSIIPSHKNLIYLQEFDNQANAIEEIQILEINEIDKAKFENKILCGTGVSKINSNIKDNTKNDVKNISELAQKYFKNSKFEDVNEFNPFYIQEFKPNKSKKEIYI